METDEQLAIRLSREEEQAAQQPCFNDNNTFKETIITPPSPAVTVESKFVNRKKKRKNDEIICIIEIIQMSLCNSINQPTMSTMIHPTGVLYRSRNPRQCQATFIQQQHLQLN